MTATRPQLLEIPFDELNFSANGLQNEQEICECQNFSVPLQPQTVASENKVAEPIETIYMKRNEIIKRIGSEFLTANIENDEYSYVSEAGTKSKLEKAAGHTFEGFKLDIRFQKGDVAVLVETKQIYTQSDEKQLAEYVEEEKAIHNGIKIIAILANTKNDKIKVWKSEVDEDHYLSQETVLDTMDHYVSLFDCTFQNDRETVLKNTLALNVLLHKKDINEDLRSQFVGTALLYIKDMVKKTGATKIDNELKEKLNSLWTISGEQVIRSGIEATLKSLLDGSDNKAKKIELLQQNVLNNQKVRNLSKESWIEILDTILMDIYRYINADSSEGQDILNMFFIAFNKYTGKSDKNQAFTPDHITDFMCRITDVDRTKVVLDATCGSGSFLVQAMVKELADCRRGRTEEEAKGLIKEVKEKHIYGIECEEKAYGLSTTNMLIHGDGNSNIKLANMFHCEDFIRQADPDVILMNPPYNSKPVNIPDIYKSNWGKAKEGKEDPTKGFVYIQFISDVVKRMNEERLKNGQPKKTVKLCVLLPMSAAIGASQILNDSKEQMLQDNRLEAVFTLPDEIFYPGAAVFACCFLFTLGQSHINADGTTNETFFGYYREDGFKKRKNLGRVEQFNTDGSSRWKDIENKWIANYRNHKIIDGLTASAIVNADKEWLCEAYMRTDYKQLTTRAYRATINNYFSYLVRYSISNSNWDFMSQYIASMSKTGNKDQIIDTQEWKPFKMTKLFKLQRGKISSLNDIDEGIMPIVSASGENEGISFWGDVEAVYQNNITVSMNGVNTGFTAYHSYSFTTNVDCCALIQKFDMNEYIGLFMATVINLLKAKYSYGRKMSAERIKTESILLPIQHNEDGTAIIDKDHKFSTEGYIPDWQFMEDFIKMLPY